MRERERDRQRKGDTERLIVESEKGRERATDSVRSRESERKVGRERERQTGRLGERERVRE